MTPADRDDPCRKLIAARVMLAALVHIRDRSRGPHGTLRGDIDAIARAAIAQAEAAGLSPDKAEG